MWMRSTRLALGRAGSSPGCRIGGLPRVCGTLQSANELLGAELLQEPDTAYTPDPDLDFAIGEAETLRQALVDAPFLVPATLHQLSAGP